MDCSPPGSSDHGIFQARGLEWGAIFSGKYVSAHFAHIPKAQIFFEDILLAEYICIMVTFPH